MAIRTDLNVIDNLSYDDLQGMSDKNLKKLGWERNNRGGFTRIRSGVEPPKEQEEIVQQEREPAADVIPCRSCKGGKAEPKKVESKTTGIASMLRAKMGKKVNEHTRRSRWALCVSCDIKDKDGDRLFREVKGVPYCGIPRSIWNPTKIIRNEKEIGCGCNLEDKVTWENAFCPHKRWGPGLTVGGNSFIILPGKTKQEVIPDTIDVVIRYSDPEGGVNLTGIGDTVAPMPVIHALAVNREKTVRARVIQTRARWAELFWPNIAIDSEESDIGDEVIKLNPKNAFGMDFMCEDQGVSRHEFWFKSLGLEEYRPKFDIPLDAIEWAKENTHEARAIKGQQIVCISPFSNSVSRTWPKHHWIDLVEMFQAENIHVVMIDGDPRRGAMIPATRFWGWGPKNIAALMEFSDLYIGNDSGMTHIAGLYEIPSIALCSATSCKTVFGWYKNMHCIQAPSACTACLWRGEHGYRRSCSATCEALWNITPNTVFNAAMHTLEEVKKNKQEKELTHA